MSDIVIKCGLDFFERKWPQKLKDSRVGLLVHPASVNRTLKHAVDIFLKYSYHTSAKEDHIIKSKKFELKALFGPQHGIRGETQDNMIEWEGFHDRQTGLPDI